MGDEFQCAVCQNGHTNGSVFLCEKCAHPDRVRTYCANCGSRGDFSLLEAKILFGLAGLKLNRTGIIFCYKYCPDCPTEKTEIIAIFAVHQDGFPPCLVAA